MLVGLESEGEVIHPDLTKYFGVEKGQQSY